jgi:uncharacterized protein (TIGR03086 family)
VDVEPVSTPEIYRRAVEEFGRRVEAIDDDQWTNPTPCTEWDVHTLVNHVMNEDKWVPPLLAGETIQQVGDRFDGDLLGADPQAAWKETKASALDAVSQPGAMERTVSLSRGPSDADGYIVEVAADNVVHAWDLAMGIGGDTTLDPELVEFAYEANRPYADGARAYGVFGPEVKVAEDADLQTRLLGMLGRKA